MATWGDLKANAATFLGIKITDADVDSVPLLATDPYGNFIRRRARAAAARRHLDRPDRMAGQQGLVEGNLAAPIATTAHSTASSYKAVAGRQHASSTTRRRPPTRSTIPATCSPPTPTPRWATPSPSTPQTGDNLSYDNELLDTHYVAGDGRVNENIGLTAVQDLFHSEHDRLVAQIEKTVQEHLNAGDISFATELGAAGRCGRQSDRAHPRGSHPGQPVERRAPVPGGEVRHRDRIPAHRVRRIRALRRAGHPRRRRRQRPYRSGDHLGVRQRRLSLRPFDAGREHQPLRARRRRQAGDRAPTASR